MSNVQLFPMPLKISCGNQRSRAAAATLHRSGSECLVCSSDAKERSLPWLQVCGSLKDPVPRVRAMGLIFTKGGRACSAFCAGIEH